MEKYIFNKRHCYSHTGISGEEQSSQVPSIIDRKMLRISRIAYFYKVTVILDEKSCGL